MKHVVLPIMDSQYDDRLFFRGLDETLVRGQFFLIDPTDRDDLQIVDIQGRAARTYQIGRNVDWDDVFGNIQSSFLENDFLFQLDVVVDAGGSARAVSVLQALPPVFLALGLTASIKIIFLADARSVHYPEEQALYNTLKQAVFDAESGQLSLKFNCAYLMIAQTDAQKTLRERILPYIIWGESRVSHPEIRTCGGQVRDLDINAIELVPKDLAVKTVCAILRTKPLDNAVSLFLLATGSNANKTPKEQLELFRDRLEEKVPVRLPGVADLLVQKGTPDGDITTRELFAKFCRDNPYSDPQLYDNASIEKLTRIPVVVNAVYEWENTIVEQICEKGDVSVYTDHLGRGSDFDTLLKQYQKPMAMTVDKTLTDKDGYSETAIQKLEQYTFNLQQMLRNAVFAARIRLIYARLPAIRKRLETVQQQRIDAVNAALEASLTKGDTVLIEDWSKVISTELTNAAAVVRLPKETDDVREWIGKNTEELMKAIPAPDFDTGRKELAESGAKIISSMRADTDEKLITVPLRPAIDVPLEPRWIVYRQMTTNADDQRTAEPVIIKISEWYLNLHQCAQMDLALFQKPLAAVTTTHASDLPAAAGTAETAEMPAQAAEEEMDAAPLIRQDKEELEIYSGTISWVWKNMKYNTARLDIYLDSGDDEKPEAPIIQQNVRYCSDDHYTIGHLNELPSGVPLIFRVVYQDRGRDVTEISHEFKMRSPRTRLEVELLSVKEGKLFGKKPYFRLKVHNTGSFFAEHVAVGSSTGHIYSAAWEPTEDGWLSELLPDCENWMLVDRPGDLVEYEIIQ